MFADVARPRRSLHATDQPIVERFSRVDPRIAQQMVQRDDFSDHRDILTWIEVDRDLGQLDFEYGRGLNVEPRPLDDGVLIPLLELDDNLDALLLTDGADPKNRGKFVA